LKSSRSTLLWAGSQARISFPDPTDHTLINLSDIELALLAKGYPNSLAYMVVSTGKSLKKLSVIFKMEEKTRSTNRLISDLIDDMNEHTGTTAKLSAVQEYPLSSNEVDRIHFELCIRAVQQTTQVITGRGVFGSLLQFERLAPGEGPDRLETWFWQAENGKVLGEEN
jgi:hypothetical protein